MGADVGRRPLRRQVLYVAVRALLHGRRTVHHLEGGDGVTAAEVVDQPLDDPVWIAQAGRVVGPLGSGCRDSAQDRLREAPGPPAELDRRGHDGVDGRAQVVQLIGAHAQQVAGVRVEGSGDEPVDQPVTGPAHPHRAVDELGDEGPVASRQLRSLQHRRQDQVGVRAFLVDAGLGVPVTLTAKGIAAGDCGSATVPCTAVVPRSRM